MEMINEQLETLNQKYKKNTANVKKRIVICAGTGCIANGSLDVIDAFQKEIEKKGVDVMLNTHDDKDKNDPVHLSGSGCQGLCAKGPLVNIYPDNILYVKVKPEDVQSIVEKTIINNKIIPELLYTDPASGDQFKGQEDIPFYKQQLRLVLNECGKIDPEDISEYIAHNGYKAALIAYTQMTDSDICKEITKSGLRGRSGGAFLTGRKWELTRKEESEKKFVICNGDEGDPGAFMDRSLMEGNPHRVLEGMMVAAKAVGADEAYVYLRLEYPLAVQRMLKAIDDAEKLGILGENIFGTKYNLKIHLMEGAGAFVCGEETALIASIEGKRGMPLPKPPFPAQKGLWGKPTVINNVETLVIIPRILLEGAEWYSSYGTNSSKGTKTFALTGHVANTGLIEVPFGTTLRKIIYDIGGGVCDESGNITNEGFKTVQIGGPSGGCLTEEDIDLPIDYDNLLAKGAMVGSGVLVVMNKQSCMVQLARFFMEFTQNESCGKCVPCREGTKQMLSMLDEIIDGTATQETLDLLIETGTVISKASLCGLGKTAPNPVLSIISKFYDEYQAHIVDKTCPSNKCKALAKIEIDPSSCIGCTACVRKCPVGAISGDKKQPHIIDTKLCTKCGICNTVCKFDAILGF